MTTMGKYRHLARCATAAGHFVVLAIDHRANLLDALNQHAAQPLTDSDFVTFKQSILRALCPVSTAVLTDPSYGHAPGVVERTISGQMGLLSPLEITDYDAHPSRRDVRFIPDWSVRKIKLAGGDGVKLLLSYHPDAPNARSQRSVVQQIIDECDSYDIPFFLEPIPFSLDPDHLLTNVERLQLTVGAAQEFSAMGVDVLKLPFPLDVHQSEDESEWRAACAAVDAACSVPWALLSAGVDYATFLRQARVACEAGASGVIVGRAVWNEAVKLQGESLSDFVNVTAAQRLQELADVCAGSAVPWFERVSAPSVSLSWFSAYDGSVDEADNQLG